MPIKILSLVALALMSAVSLATKRVRTIGCLLLLLGASLTLRAETHGHDHATAPASLVKSLQPARSADANPIPLPPLPEGVADLKFSDFFVMPVGSRGLEMTEKLRGLDGQRVRVLGYMAQEESPVRGRFLLAAIPVQIHSHDNSLADDLPPAVLHVFASTARGQRIPYAPGLMLLSGTLSVGNHDEADGRVSIARLALDPPETMAGWPTASGGFDARGKAATIFAIVVLISLAAWRWKHRSPNPRLLHVGNQ